MSSGGGAVMAGTEAVSGVEFVDLLFAGFDEGIDGRPVAADMVLAPSVAGLFKWRQFEPEVILLAVGWYLRFSLSYRAVEELLAERDLRVDHVTVWNPPERRVETV